MSALTDLRQRLEDLPAKRERSQRAKLVTQYGTMIAGACAAIESARQAQKWSSEVFESAKFVAANEKIKEAAKVAKRLHKKLSQDMATIRNAATEEAVQEISESAQGSLTTVKGSWATLIDEEVTRYKKLVETANRLQLTGYEDFQASLTKLQQSREVPRSESDVRRVRNAMKALAGAVASLGWQGAVAAFMEQAAGKAGASLEEALVPAVKDFIEQHDLWSLFRVHISR